MALVKSQQIRGGTTRNIDAVYDKGSNRITLTYPQSKNIAYTYDANNRVSRILDGANARARYLYVGPSRRSQMELLNGGSTVSTLKVAYDGVARITSALYRNAADNATIIGFQHDYDKMGKPKYEVRTHQSSYGDEYTYDNLHRVTRTVYDDSTPTTPTASPADGAKEDFRYDDIGNRTKAYLKSASATTYLHNTVNEYTKVTNTEYQYDAAGNLTKDATHYYYWDYENRLTKVKLVADSSDVAEYTYDATMRRVEKVDERGETDVITRFYYDSWSVIEERDGGGTLQATYINGPGIDEYILMNRDSTDYWYMQSPIIGNVAALVDSNGAIQEGYKYRAYGQCTVLTADGDDDTWFTADDTTATTSAIANPYTFTGRRLDPETMLLYFRNRMYQLVTGSFISRDLEGYFDTMALYEYVQGKPLILVDPTGLNGQSLLDDIREAMENYEELRHTPYRCMNPEHCEQMFRGCMGFVPATSSCIGQFLGDLGYSVLACGVGAGAGMAVGGGIGASIGCVVLGTTGVVITMHNLGDCLGEITERRNTCERSRQQCLRIVDRIQHPERYRNR